MRLFHLSLLCLALAPGALLCAVAAQPAAPETITNSLGMKLVRIPAGKFVMGSPATETERDPEEEQHEVAITRPFYLGAHEVTQAQLRQLRPKNTPHFTPALGGGAQHAAELVRWTDAVDFCHKLSSLPDEKKAGRTYRLPTEAEWEYACRAGTTTTFASGDALPATAANFNAAPHGPFLRKTTRVGSYAPNAWGLYDMHGNVAEWCADWYDPDYYKRSPRDNPTGPDKGVLSTGFGADCFRVVRGGSWLDDARACRSAYRFRLQSVEPYWFVGFRVVCVLREEK